MDLITIHIVLRSSMQRFYNTESRVGISVQDVAFLAACLHASACYNVYICKYCKNLLVYFVQLQANGIKVIRYRSKCCIDILINNVTLLCSVFHRNSKDKAKSLHI